MSRLLTYLLNAPPTVQRSVQLSLRAATIAIPSLLLSVAGFHIISAYSRIADKQDELVRYQSFTAGPEANKLANRDAEEANPLGLIDTDAGRLKLHEIVSKAANTSGSRLVSYANGSDETELGMIFVAAQIRLMGDLKSIQQFSLALDNQHPRILVANSGYRPVSGQGSSAANVELLAVVQMPTMSEDLRMAAAQ